jgi:hypothetical protein
LRLSTGLNLQKSRGINLIITFLQSPSRNKSGWMWRSPMGRTHSIRSLICWRNLARIQIDIFGLNGFFSSTIMNIPWNCLVSLFLWSSAMWILVCWKFPFRHWPKRKCCASFPFLLPLLLLLHFHDDKPTLNDFWLLSLSQIELSWTRSFGWCSDLRRPQWMKSWELTKRQIVQLGTQDQLRRHLSTMIDLFCLLPAETILAYGNRFIDILPSQIE